MVFYDEARSSTGQAWYRRSSEKEGTAGHEQVFQRGDRHCIGGLESLGCAGGGAVVQAAGSYRVQKAEGMGHVEGGNQSPLFCIVPR